MPHISVIICAHNPRPDYFRRALDVLKAQTLPVEKWELLLIDNASREPLAQAWDLSWHPQSRHVREDELGVVPAHLRGIGESRGDLLVFVDDDNELDTRYLEIAEKIAVEWPRIGVFGGSQMAVYEETPAPDVQAHCAAYLSVRIIPQTLWTNIKGTWGATPIGAGMCVRRHLVESYARTATSDRFRKMLGRSAGEDSDLAWSVCDAGYGMLVTPELRLNHLIGKKRLEKSYLLPLIERREMGTVALNHIHGLPQPGLERFHLLRFRLHILRKMRGFDRLAGLAVLKGRVGGLRILRGNSG